MVRSYGTYGLWGGLWSTGTVMYANTGRHIVVSPFFIFERKNCGKYKRYDIGIDIHLRLPIVNRKCLNSIFLAFETEILA